MRGMTELAKGAHAATMRAQDLKKRNVIYTTTERIVIYDVMLFPDARLISVEGNSGRGRWWWAFDYDALLQVSNR